MKGDKRKINKVWDACNPKGEWHTFAIVGSGKDSYIKTLRAGGMSESDYNLIGTIARH